MVYQPDMPELPIHPAPGREAPGYELERRLKRLAEAHGALRSKVSAELRHVCVHQTLLLTGHEISREDVVLGRDPLVPSLLSALELLEAEAARRPEPNRRLVQEVHRLAHRDGDVDGAFRTTERPPQFESARPSSPQFVVAKLDNLFEWLGAESARTMFPAERMTLFFARFLEIAPFDRGNFRTAHLSLSLFAHAAGFPCVSLLLDEAEDIRGDVDRAIRFDTAPLVERLSAAISRSLSVWEELSEAPR